MRNGAENPKSVEPFSRTPRDSTKIRTGEWYATIEPNDPSCSFPPETLTTQSASGE